MPSPPLLELSTSLLAEIGGWPTLMEARALVTRGKVLEVARDGAVIRARIQGGEKIYDAQITLADRIANIEVSCTCAHSRRTGRVCAHALAAGVALLGTNGYPRTTPAVPRGGTVSSGPDTSRGLQQSIQAPNPKRYLPEDAPTDAPQIEVTVLLPIQFEESLKKDPVRVILEGRLASDEQPRPWDSLVPLLKSGCVVSEQDDRVLTVLEQITGSAAGINAIPRAKMGIFLRSLSGHSRVWFGKKQQIEIMAATERLQIDLSLLPDRALQLAAGRQVSSRPSGKALPSLPNWTLDGNRLFETPRLPSGFSSGMRLIPADKIPDFLTRDFPELERNADLIFAPGLEEFRLEIDTPIIEARLDGALSGLTLELVAHYGDQTFSLTEKTESSAYQRYFPDPVLPQRFWRRNVRAERAALAQAESASFTPVRPGASTFSLIRENQVAAFLANTLSRWRNSWTITPGARLQSTLAEIDLAQPEFSLRGGAGEDWLSLDLKLSVNGKPVPLEPAEIQRWLQTGQSHARTPGKRVLMLPTESWSEMREVLTDCVVEQEPGTGKIRVAPASIPFLTGALKAQGFAAREIDAKKFPAPDIQAKLDPQLWAQLRPYQIEGVTWLANLAQQNLHGLLADDMGLGKTLQALAFCAWLKTAPSSLAAVYDRRALVVCPTSLVTNWQREAARFTPQLRTLDLTGPDRAEKFSRRNEYDLLVTSYAILRRDIEKYRTDEFSLVILDEAQHIKNRASQNAQSAKALRAHHRLILTGTPLENSVLDLWSLYDFLLPGYLGTAAEFRERYETPLTRQPAPRIMERLRHRVRPFFLRRTKEEVLTELPPKLEHSTLCDLTDEQREVYRAVLAQGRRDVFEHAGKGGQTQNRIAVLTTLLRLRQVCCHLDLLPQGENKRAWKMPSAKMDRTFELIDEAIDGGHRVLLFSQFVRVLHLLREEARRREISFCYLDGQTVERQAEVDRFQNDAAIPLFFISLKAGGTGLNLTGADTVIHFDPWWNPAVEEQATSRAHRMGQSRSVQAYKLIAAGTVEEKIQALQARKRELFEASLGRDEAFVDKLTGDDLEELLKD